MKKVEIIKELFEKELITARSNKEAFFAANQKFKDKTGLSGYSCYESFLNMLRKL